LFLEVYYSKASPVNILTNYTEFQ